MKNRVLISLSLLASFELSLLAVTTETTTTFEDIPSNVQIDKYGNSFYERKATITTKNFKVDNFWSRFSDKADNQSIYENISRTGTFKITTETTSACTLDTQLAAQGCSGQKPFLLNDEVLLTPIAGTSDEFEVAFVEASGFSPSAANSFYPLDILRSEAYYKEPTVATASSSGKSFFSFFTGAFDFIFSKTIGMGGDFFGKADIADEEYTPRSDDAEDRRQRYIANIIAGIEQEHRMTKATDDSTATQINPNVNTPTSLLHYAEAKKSTEEEQCQMMFLTMSADGLMCRMMSGFGMDAWMPFFNKTKTTKMQASYIMGDTENALLAMTGKIENVPYMNDVGGDDDNQLSFLQNMLKPMTTMINMMKVFMFGTDRAPTAPDPVERVYAFSQDEAMTMTFAVTNDGTQVDDFANFKLLKLRSVYGDTLDSCTVEYDGGMFGAFMGSKDWRYTFTPADGESVVATGRNWRGSYTVTVDNSDITIDRVRYDNYMDWCQTSTGGLGMFDYLTNWRTGGFMNPLNWMKGMASGMMDFMFGGLDIVDIASKVTRGLILDLKKVNPDPTSPRNSRIIEVIEIR